MTQQRRPKRMYYLMEPSQDYVLSRIAQLLSSQRANLRAGLSGGFLVVTLDTLNARAEIRMPIGDVERLEFAVVRQPAQERMPLFEPEDLKGSSLDGAEPSGN